MSRPINPTALLAGAALTFALTLAWQLVDTATLRAAAETAFQEQPDSIRKQPQADIDRKSVGCLTCHTPDARSMGIVTRTAPEEGSSRTTASSPIAQSDPPPAADTGGPLTSPTTSPDPGSTFVFERLPSVLATHT